MCRLIGKTCKRRKDRADAASHNNPAWYVSWEWKSASERCSLAST